MTPPTHTLKHDTKPAGRKRPDRDATTAAFGVDPGSPRIDGSGWCHRLAANRRSLIAALALAVAVTTIPSGLPLVARLTLALFAVLVVLTSFSALSEPIVCGAVLFGLVATGGSSLGDAVGAASGGTVWLLVGAFVVAAAARTSGIAERAALSLGSRATTVRGLFWLVAAGVLATAFLVPSTAGRATLLLPVYLAIADQLPSPAARRALSVLIPSVVLLTAIAALFGAGANLITVELLASMGNRPIDLVQWTLYGLPFAAASTALTTVVVQRLFMSAGDRRAPVDVDPPSGPWTRPERIVTGVIVVMIASWLSEPVHGVAPWIVAIVGAGTVLVGPLRLITIAEARKAIPLDLLILLIVTAEAGAALARTGAADWIATSLLEPVMDGQRPALTVVSAVAAVALVAHLVITSRTARASVLIPVVLIVAGTAGLEARGLAFLTTTAVGYCMTTTTSAKPIRVFAEVADGYTAADLRKLSACLLPLHFILLLLFAFTAWPAMGLAIQPASASTADTGVEQPSFPWSELRITDLAVGPRVAPSPEPVSAEPDLDDGVGDGTSGAGCLGDGDPEADEESEITDPSARSESIDDEAETGADTDVDSAREPNDDTEIEGAPFTVADRSDGRDTDADIGGGTPDAGEDVDGEDARESDGIDADAEIDDGPGTEANDDGDSATETADTSDPEDVTDSDPHPHPHPDGGASPSVDRADDAMAVDSYHDQQPSLGDN